MTVYMQCVCVCVAAQDNEDLVLETFYHQDGSSYTCAYQGGQRFILDLTTQVTPVNQWHRPR